MQHFSRSTIFAFFCIASHSEVGNLATAVANVGNFWECIFASILKTYDFQCFRDIAIQPSKGTKKAPKGAPGEPKITPRALQDVQGATQDGTTSSQERPKSAQGAPQERPRAAQEARETPRAPQERPRCHFGAFVEPPGCDFPPIFDDFGAHVGLVLIPLALLFCSVPLVLVLGAAQLIRVGGCPR